MKLDANVLVVGGGPAGATAASLLAQNGKDIILLEKNLSYAKPCGGGLALSAFDEFDIPKTFIKKKVYGIRLISPKGERVEIGLNDYTLTIVERKEFDDGLREKAQSQGARVLEGEFLRVLDDKRVIVEALIGEEKVQIISEYIIAADGVNSRVRASLGISPTPSLITASEMIKRPNMDICEFWFDSASTPYSYSWVFPVHEGASIGLGTFEPKKIDSLFRTFKTQIGMISSGKEKIYRIPVWKGDLYNKGKILFAGDSAGQVLPLSYEGIYYAMKAGDLAARAVMEGKAEHYKKMWKARFQKRFILLDKLKNYFLKDNDSAEKLVRLHRRPEVQEVSLMLWFRKDSGPKSLFHYVKLFRKFLS